MLIYVYKLIYLSLHYSSYFTVHLNLTYVIVLLLYIYELYEG